MKGKVTGFKIFMGIFRSMFHGFFCLFCGPPWLGHSYSSIFKKDLFSLHKVDDKVVLAVKTDDVTSSRRDVVSARVFMGSSGGNGSTKTLKLSFAYSFTQFGILWSDLVVLSLRVHFFGKLSTLPACGRLYFLCCTRKRDVCVTPSLIVFQRPAGFPRSWVHAVIGWHTVRIVQLNADWLLLNLVW